MMQNSTNDELEAIERSARSAPSDKSRPKITPASEESDSRRGSSLFSGPDATMRDLLRMAEAQDGRAGDIVVDFPTSDDANYTFDSNPKSFDELAPKVNPTGVAAGDKSEKPRRNSVVIRPMGGLGGLMDFDDSDFDDSDDEDGPEYNGGLPGAPMPGTGSSTPGGPNHRPMVGGFAAAAYEAARAYHYQHEDNKGKKAAIPKRQGPPPSI